MKKRNLFLATLFVVAFVSVAVVSCKKETQNATSNPTSSLKAFNPEEIEDMNAYLKDFKQKMQSVSKDNDEALSLEDAAWHLSSLANYDFAKLHAEYNNLRFDTLYSTAKVTANSILLSDLALSYENIHKSISDFYYNLVLENKGILFTVVSISECGDITVSLITTFKNNSKGLYDTCYYYNGVYTAMCTCYDYFDEFPVLPVQSTGTTELQIAINLEGIEPLDPGYCYIPISSKTFVFDEYIDSYGSPSLWNSRLYAKSDISTFTYFNLKIDDEICYYLDSYLGLGVQYCPTYKYITSMYLSLVTDDNVLNYPGNVQRHELKVYYGDIINTIPGHDPLTK